MATTRAAAKPSISLLDADRHDVLGLVLSAALPLAVFVIANGIAELNGMLPLFFSPLGLPGWVGGALHLVTLPLFGIARWMVAARGVEGRKAGWWLVGLMGGTIAMPFLIAPFDSMTLTILAFALLLVGFGAWARVAKVDGKAALLMAPGIGWLGFSAFVGLSFAAAWAPPFAVTNSNSAA